MAPHSNTLVWRIPWTEEPGRLQSMGSRRVGHNWVTSLSLFPFMHWRRKWQPTPVFLPGESQGRGSLVGCDLWGRTKLDTTEATQQQQQQQHGSFSFFLAPFHIASLLTEMARLLYIFPKRGYKPGKIWSSDITTLTFTVFSLFFWVSCWHSISEIQHKIPISIIF